MSEKPWKTEPDRVEWIDEATGLLCLMVRVPDFGSWCGYVGVPYEHPWYGRHYSKVGDLDVHGGLTFSDRSTDRVFHSEAANVWWLGFDCAHAFDLVPYLNLGPGVYRDLAYVRAEVVKLARQIRAH